MHSPWLGLLLLMTLVSSAWVQAEERISRFESDIHVEEAGDIVVTENITVHTESKQIRHGIFRDIPTDYKDRLGNRIRVGFELLSVQRDDLSEPYHTQRQDNGIRIYVGDKEHLLPPGHYRYSLRYRMTRVLGFFPEHDELYWNVTGNGWIFAIEKASARVHLPESIAASAIHSEGYTGLQGSQAQDYHSEVAWDGSVEFQTTQPLEPKAGLSIVVTWPKGYIREPTARDKLGFLLTDNLSLVIGMAGLGLLLSYYLMVWYWSGRDPRPGVIIPLYQPPEGYSPASMRFIRRMGYDHKGFASALINLAVKGYLEIDEDSDKQWTLHKTGRQVTMAPGETVLAKYLFGDADSIVLTQTNHNRIGKAIKAHKRALRTEYESVYFHTNTIYLVPGLLISLGLLAGAVLAFRDTEALAVAGFMSIWLTGWTLGTAVLVSKTYTAWRSVSSGGYASAIQYSLFSLPFLGFWCFGLFMLSEATSVSFLIILLLTVGINLTFYQLMKAPTRTGRRLLDKIDGFRHYLKVAEAEELADKAQLADLKLYERYLPYALALDVEQAWSDRFAVALAQVGQGEQNYRPGWYRGRSWSTTSPVSFASGLGTALSGAIASSSQAPGSSSGSGGGGSSGGGGGGGGGGGW